MSRYNCKQDENVELRPVYTVKYLHSSVIFCLEKQQTFSPRDENLLLEEQNMMGKFLHKFPTQITIEWTEEINYDGQYYQATFYIQVKND